MFPTPKQPKYRRPAKRIQGAQRQQRRRSKNRRLENSCGQLVGSQDVDKRTDVQKVHGTVSIDFRFFLETASG